MEKAESSTFEDSYNILGTYKYIEDTEAFMGALQLALDGKIYLASVKRENRINQTSNYLSVINKPNQKTCDYVFKGYKLSNYTAFLGLPSFIQSFFRPEVTKFVTSDYCDGDNIVLHSDYFQGYRYKWFGPNNFVSYTCDTVINNPDKSYAGTYKLFVTDTFGFKDSTYFEIKYHKTDITTEIIDTNTKKFVTGDYEKTFKITNNYSEPAQIDSLYLKSGEKYSLENVTPPFTIYANEVRNYKIHIDTRKPGCFRDTLILIIHQPCPYNEKIPLADSVGKVVLHIVLPDTTVNLGEIFTSDIKAYVEPKTGLSFKFDLNFTYSYLSYIFNPTKYQQHPYSKTISGNYELYTLSFPQLDINDSIKILTKVRGITLLAREYMTPLEFNDATISLPDIDLVLHNGKIQVMREDCTKELFQIQGTNIHVAFSQPTPLVEGGKFELFSPDKGPLKLTIYNSTGQKVEEYNFLSNGLFSREIEPDMTKYSNGIYSIIWESNLKTYKGTILINK